MLEKLRDPGKLPLAAGTVEDIIEATHQEALRRAAFFQSAIFNSINFSSITTDAKGVIQIFNVGAEHMLGYLATEVVNKITPADLSDPQEVIARAKALSVEHGTSIAPCVGRILRDLFRLMSVNAQFKAGLIVRV